MTTSITPAVTEHGATNTQVTIALVLSGVALFGFVVFCIVFVSYLWCRDKRHTKSYLAPNVESAATDTVTLMQSTSTREASTCTEPEGGIGFLLTTKSNEYQHDTNLKRRLEDEAETKSFLQHQDILQKGSDRTISSNVTNLSVDKEVGKDRLDLDFESRLQLHRSKNEGLYPMNKIKTGQTKHSSLLLDTPGYRELEDPVSPYGNVDLHEFLILNSPGAPTGGNNELLSPRSPRNDEQFDLKGDPSLNIRDRPPQPRPCLHHELLKLRLSLPDNVNRYPLTLDSLYDHVDDEIQREPTHAEQLKSKNLPRIYENANQKESTVLEPFYNSVDSDDSDDDDGDCGNHGDDDGSDSSTLRRRTKGPDPLYENTHDKHSPMPESLYDDCVIDERAAEPSEDVGMSSDHGCIYENSYEKKSSTEDSSSRSSVDDSASDAGSDLGDSDKSSSIYENSYRREKSSKTIGHGEPIPDRFNNKSDLEESGDLSPTYENPSEHELAPTESVYDTMDDDDCTTSPTATGCNASTVYQNVDSCKAKVSRTKSRSSDELDEDDGEEPIRLSHIYANLTRFKRELLRQSLGSFPPQISHPPPPSL